jgi:hypothetical protein
VRSGTRHFSIWTDRAGAGPLTLGARGLYLATNATFR